MELEKLEKRRDEIIGYNNQIVDELNRIDEARRKLVNQYQVNTGALSEVNLFIEAIKKNDIETKTEEIIEDKKVEKKNRK